MERFDVEHWSAREVAKLLTLVENEKRYYQEILALLPMGVAVVARDGSIVSVNRAFRSYFGLRHDEVASRLLTDLIRDPEKSAQLTKAIASGSGVQGMQLLIEDSQGVAKEYRLTACVLADWYQENTNDLMIVIEEPDAEAATGGRFLEGIGGAVWGLDPASGKILFGNQLAARLLGSDAASRWRERIHPDDAPRVAMVHEAALKSGSEAIVDYRATLPDGSDAWLSDRVLPASGAAGPVLNIVTTNETLRHEQTERSAHARKMEAITRTAGKLSHDFNNILMIINGNVEEVQQSLRADDPRRAGLEDVLKAAERMFAITQQLLLISRPSKANPAVVNLNQLLSDLRLAARILPSDGVEPVNIDPKHLESSLRALLEMAIPDLPPAIEVGRISIGSDFGADAPKGDFVVLKIGPVDDSTPDTESIWSEPFFAKSKRLSTAYTALRGMGCWIGFRRGAARQNAHFEILIPRVETPQPVEPPKAPAMPVEAARPQPEAPAPNRETVLVVDDEESIRSLVARVLKRHGYRVLEAPGSVEAISLAGGASEEIPLIVTDVMLPGLRGTELVTRLRETRPGLRALFMSGYTDDPKLAAGALPKGEAFLQKPFTLAALLETVRIVLDEPEG